MTIIKIDRSSIKPNPRAGATSSMMQGPSSATFEFPQGGKIPANLLDKVEIVEWERAEKPEDVIRLRGYITNPDDWEQFIKVPGISISVDNGLQRIYHMLEPGYLYKYEDAAVPCSNCHGLVFWKDIGIDYDDEGNEYETCPLCHEQDTFDWRLESIEEALKEANA